MLFEAKSDQLPTLLENRCRNYDYFSPDHFFDKECGFLGLHKLA
jgi:hypothetical protein